MASNANFQLVGPIKQGRPLGSSSFTQEIADEICERIADGEILDAICKDDHMPTSRTVNNWLLQHAEFYSDYARARLLQGTFEADETKKISDDPEIPAEHKRIMVETRKWRAERLNRIQWGAKVEHQHEHTLHPTIGAEGLPASLEFLAGRLRAAERDTEPVDSPVGEG